jgi:hypothetical protein
MITTEHFDFPVKWSKDHLVNAQKQFNRDPSATNWNVCLRAMMTRQQLDYALRSSTVDRAKLFGELESSPLSDWQDLICLNTLGLSCADALNQA